MSDHQNHNIYFDITDIVRFATTYSTVTGIQRVQLNIISNIARQNKSHPIYCTFLHPKTKKLSAFKPLEILSEKEFDAYSMLYRLGLLEVGGRVPPKHKIKKYLNEFSDNKLLRSLKKLEVYSAALLSRRRLESLGLKDKQERRLTHLSRVLLNEIQMDPKSTYVILGAHWGFKDVINMFKSHSANGGKVIQMIYDLIPHSNPDFCNKDFQLAFDKWLKDVSENVDRFVCISQYTAQALKQFLGTKAAGKIIEAVPLAHEFGGYPRDPAGLAPTDEIAKVVAKPYVLCVGTIEIRKNGVTLLKVWSHLIETLGDQTPTLVFAGRKGWLIDEFDGILESSEKLQRFIKIIETPSDFDLVALYRNCLFTVFPSFSEGWGLPVGESVWFGKFCLGSNTTSVPEVCGDLIDYVDPVDVDSMTEKIKYLIQNPDYIRSREITIRNARLRTWADVSRDLFKFINRD